MATLKDLKGMVDDTHSGKEWHKKHGLPKSSAAHKALSKKTESGGGKCTKCGSSTPHSGYKRCSDCI